MNILDEKWTDFYDECVHTNVRTVNDHFVFSSGPDWLRKHIIDLHNTNLERDKQPQNKQ